MTLPFNKPYLSGNELEYIEQAVRLGKLSGNGVFTGKCQQFLEKKFGFKKCLLTTSCTDALEMCALLIDIQPGDEVIIPSYTFVSTALAFVRQGAVIRFADSRADHPGMDENSIEALINERTKAIVPVHYAGVACDMQKIMDIADRHRLHVIEDAAHAINSMYHFPSGNQMALGSIGHLAAFSFQETKNIHCGEGGCLAINDESLIDRAEIIWEKGTNRAAFFRGESDRYTWRDLGSSFLPPETSAAFLWAQFENLDTIQNTRLSHWYQYQHHFLEHAAEDSFLLPQIPSYAVNNAHIFYLVFPSLEIRTKVINHLQSHGILAVFHYLSLHKSPYYRQKHDGRTLPNADRYTDTLLRLPLFFELSEKNIEKISNLVLEVCL